MLLHHLHVGIHGITPWMHAGTCHPPLDKEFYTCCIAHPLNPSVIPSSSRVNDGRVSMEKIRSLKDQSPMCRKNIPVYSVESSREISVTETSSLFNKSRGKPFTFLHYSDTYCIKYYHWTILSHRLPSHGHICNRCSKTRIIFLPGTSSSGTFRIPIYLSIYVCIQKWMRHPR